jgi:hypothetical protein
MPIQTASPIPVLKERSFVSFTHAQVDGSRSTGCEGDGDDPAALAGNDQSPMSSLHTKVFDVSVERLRDPQPVQGQQTRQSMITSTTETSLNQKHAQFVAVQANCS